MHVKQPVCLRVAEHTVIKFPEMAFLDPSAYITDDETTESIGWYGDIMTGRRDNDVFKVSRPTLS